MIIDCAGGSRLRSPSPPRLFLIDDERSSRSNGFVHKSVEFGVVSFIVATYAAFRDSRRLFERIDKFSVRELSNCY